MTTPPLASPPWPNVPACYGWLSLDRRGQWRLQGEPVRHAGMTAFLNARYGPSPDGSGRWQVTNGPQAVFVSLAYTPWVLRLYPDHRLLTHCQTTVSSLAGVWLDEEGSVLIQFAEGIGVLDDRDLPAFYAECRDVTGQAASDEALLAALEGRAALTWQGLPLGRISRSAVAGQFAFDPNPQQPA